MKRTILVLLICFTAHDSATLAQSFRIPLRVVANSGAHDTLWFGVDTTATFCVDPTLGEEFLGPVPPSVTFDARFVNPRPVSGPDFCFDQGTRIDIRPFLSTTQIDTYKIYFQAGDNGTPVRFSWPDLNPYYTNPVWLGFPVDASIVYVNMKTDTTYLNDWGSYLYIVTGDPLHVPQPPSVSTSLPNFVTRTSARLHGNLNPNGYATSAWFEWGTTTSYGNSTTPQSMGTGLSFVSDSAQLSGLTPGVTYHYRCVGQNTNGTTYGNDQTFTTILDTISRTVIPIHVTDNYSDLITVWVGVHPQATFCVDPSLGEEYLPPPPPSITFDVRLMNPRTGDPQCFDQGTWVDLRPYIGPSQVDTFKLRFQGDYNLGFTFFWPNLDSFFTEPVRLLDPFGGLAVNVDMKAETSYTLTTSTYTYIPFLFIVLGTPTAPPRPAVLTNPPSNIQYNSAELAGLTNPNGFETTAWFEWGTTPNYGNVTPAQSVGSGSSTIPVDRPVVGLSSSTVYYCRVVAQNSNGTMAGPDRSFTTPSEVTNQYSVAAGWGLISVPMIVNDGRTTVLFPTAISDAFGFNLILGYVRRDTLVNGEGYWLKFESAQNVSITGIPISLDSIDVVTGWNLVGTITDTIDVANVVQIPPGILQSPFFEFTGFYNVSNILSPAKAYWVRSGATGRLVLSAGTARLSGVSRQK